MRKIIFFVLLVISGSNYSMEEKKLEKINQVQKVQGVKKPVDHFERTLPFMIPVFILGIIYYLELIHPFFLNESDSN